MGTFLETLEPWKFLAGLALFLLGLSFIEASLKNSAGKSFRNFLRYHTKTPIQGILAGTATTALLQSSTVVTLMVLAFVGAGIISLKNALGVIFGSNLGTTFTGWIVATLGFKVDFEAFTLPLIAVGGFMFMFFDKRKRFHEAGRF